jgi:hypothetical protein
MSVVDAASELWSGLRRDAAPVERALFGALLGVIVLTDLMSYEVPRTLIADPERLRFVPLPLLPPGDATSAFAFGLQIAMNLWALSLASGRYARLASGLLAFTYGYVLLVDRARFTSNGLLLVLSLLLVAAEPIDPERPSPEWPSWVGRALISVIYLVGAFMKLSPSWLSGEILQAALFTYGRKVYADVFGWDLPLLFPVLAVFATAFEGFMALALWSPRLRRVAIVMGTAFHLSIEALLPVRVFSFAMVAAYTLFLPARCLGPFVRLRRTHFVRASAGAVCAALASHLGRAWLLQTGSAPRRHQFALWFALLVWFGFLAAFPHCRAPSAGSGPLLPVALRRPLFGALLSIQFWGVFKPAFGFTDRFGWKMFSEVTEVGGTIELEQGGAWVEYPQNVLPATPRPIWDSLSERTDLMRGTARRALDEYPSARRARVSLNYVRNGSPGTRVIHIER